MATKEMTGSLVSHYLTALMTMYTLGTTKYVMCFLFAQLKKKVFYIFITSKSFVKGFSTRKKEAMNCQFRLRDILNIAWLYAMPCVTCTDFFGDP